MKKTGKVMGVDIETYSDVDIAKAGVYAYAESPEFEILLIAYQIDNGPVKVIETWPQVWKADRENLDLMAGPRGCKEFWDALTDPTAIKYAYNANFERTCLAAWTGKPMPPEQWRCTMVHAATLGLPGSLGAVGAALGLPEDKQKDRAGKALIQYFCKPCKPTKANGGRLRNMPADAPEKWAQFVEYNRQDVVTEAAIRDRLSVYPVPEAEQQLWSLDQHMNDHGIRVDMGLVRNILQFDAVYQEKLLDEARRITGIENPNSLSQLKDWFFRECGLDVKSLTKDTIPGLEEDLREFRGGLLIDQETFDKGTRMLKIRTELGKVSTKKYIAMENAVCEDGRLRGILQFYGANRTGRWAGRIVQVHNLPQNKIPDIDLARALAAEGDFEGVQLLFGEVPFVFSQLIRTAFVPDPGCTFVVADFSAIEARVVAWLAGEEWVLEAFRQGKDIYCETASQMYHVPVEKHGQNSHLRQKGKIATLACIAKGQPVLTDHGLVPIEEVTTEMKLWDGIEWVSHSGVISKGKRRCIRYGGLEATEDHIVWAEIRGKSRPVQFGEAARSGAHLTKSGSGGKAIRMGQDHFSGKTLHKRMVRVLRADRVHGMRTKELDQASKPDAREVERLPELQPETRSAVMAGPSIHSSETEMRESARSAIQKLWGARNPFRVSKCNRRLPVHDRDTWAARSKAGDRPSRQQRELYARQSAMGNTERTECEQTDQQEIQVYDILNAGPRNRFTVSDVLVHNCGYQGGVGAMKAMDKSGTIPEEELQGIVNQWREANPNIVRLWRDYEAAAKVAIQERRTVKRGVRVQAANLAEREYMAGGPVRPYSVREGVYVAFEYLNGNLFVRLPSGRKLCYWGAKVETDPETGRDQITYAGVEQATRQWSRRETYGGKLVENIVQATARDCLAETMRKVDAAGYSIVMHIHDEIVCEVPYKDGGNLDDLKAITDIMAQPVSWAPGLPLRGDGYVTPFYKKD